MEADEHPQGSPFNDYTKLQVLVSKARSDVNIRWAFSAVLLSCTHLEGSTLFSFSFCLPRWDGYLNGWLKSEYLGKRALAGESWTGGTVVMVVGMGELKKILLTESCAWPGFIKVTFREPCAFKSPNTEIYHSGKCIGTRTSSRKCWMCSIAMEAIASVLI